jgi:acetyl-CoA carboxylase, biotin carboxylase subunit
MFRRILIANRGEVAARVMRTCRALGLDSVAISTDADMGLQFLEGATTVVNIGDNRAYLDIDRVIAAGREAGCSAVHPGWGFLSENATFAARCESVGITFIGPASGTMRRMADKAQARSVMASLGVATIPGSDGVLDSIEDTLQVARSLGYPVLIKPVSGGGGRGMRRVDSDDDVAAAFTEGSAEALAAFGDGRMYAEKLIENGRHIEFQVIGDGKRVQILGERECSIQRRHQKLLEETPSPVLADEAGCLAKASIARKLAAACEAIGYRGAGTIEMLRAVDGSLYFMEMNTRLQVEHTVTEEVLGQDLVAAQLAVAANQRLPDFPAPVGWAIQCRINAEDPQDGFRPVPGQLTRFQLPQGEGIRVDTHLSEGDQVSPHYDSMIAKVIAHGPDRATAISRLRQALDEMKVEGVVTTIELHRRILAHPGFVAGDTDTGFLDRELEGLLS